MKSDKKFMDEFMRILDNMEKYHGIDITKPETYFGDPKVVQAAFDTESRIAATVEAEVISDVVVADNSEVIPDVVVVDKPEVISDVVAYRPKKLRFTKKK